MKNTYQPKSPNGSKIKTLDEVTALPFLMYFDTFEKPFFDPQSLNTPKNNVQ